jgi:hypothetical protein
VQDLTPGCWTLWLFDILPVYPQQGHLCLVVHCMDGRKTSPVFWFLTIWGYFLTCCLLSPLQTGMSVHTAQSTTAHQLPAASTWRALTPAGATPPGMPTLPGLAAPVRVSVPTLIWDWGWGDPTSPSIEPTRANGNVNIFF